MAELSKDKFVIEGKRTSDAESIVRPSLTYWADAWRRLKTNKMAITAMVILIIVTLFAIFAPILSEFDYRTGDLLEVNRQPDAEHWFGTDELGRDLYVRVWEGTRISLFIGIVTAMLNFTIGVLYGGISGYVGGNIDNIMMRIVEILFSIPYLLWVIMLTTVMGSGLFTIIVALSIAGWGGMARLVRGQILQIKEMEFVMAAKTLGADAGRIITKHLIPNTIGVIIISVTFAIPTAIFAEAFLSFIGLGIKVPYASLGSLSKDGTRMLLVHPYQLVFPSIVISLIMLSFQIFGDGLRDALDPRLRQ
ncbi:ABC transporter permease [Clostridium sp. D2Q-11]|uniref:ABC transporter permease n=1 Tax=Anaeromonas frigoriresistens TaxID=2683708 RepID=A0A942UPP3_9FIRM|nr:ABC transporter permease [Anaeromonas frigoriresistens]MBS4536999.1 ABC transporter permease [Anaeromonas frigoriresistens]